MAKPTRYTPAEMDHFVAEGFWKTTISHVWDQNALSHPDRMAIGDLRKTLTWSEAARWTNTVALNFLALGLKRDDVVVVQLPNCIELHLLRVACEKAGVLCMPVTANLREKEMQYILKASKTAAVVIPPKYKDFDFLQMIRNIRLELDLPRHILTTGSQFPEGVHSVERLSEKPLKSALAAPGDLEARRFKPTEISIINLTSGSTGFPKFVEYPAGANAAWGDGQAPVIGLTADDRVGTFAPAARGPSLPAYYDAPWVAAAIFMFPWNRPHDALRAIEENNITVACIVPTQISKMLEQYKAGRYDLGTVRLWYSAGAIFPPALAKEVEATIGGIIINDYGAVDFGGIICPHVDDPQAVRVHTVGKPRFGTEIMIADGAGNAVGPGEVGEVWGRGPACASGYYNDPRATRKTWTKDGWFPMGDLGKIDAQGNLVIAGRKKNVIIRGAQNIYPSEIEGLLITHPDIREAVVVGMPDPVMGERVCAYVVIKENTRLTFEETVAFLKEKKIASFKLPERLEIINKFPLVADQKIDIQALREDIAAKLHLEKGGKASQDI